MTARFDGKVAVETGPAGGIGAATARRLASEGAAVALVDLTAPRDLTEQIVSIGGSARAYACDITDRAGVEAVFEEVVTDLGWLHILINNAGIQTLTATLAIEVGNADPCALSQRAMARRTSAELPGNSWQDVHTAVDSGSRALWHRSFRSLLAAMIVCAIPLPDWAVRDVNDRGAGPTGNA